MMLPIPIMQTLTVCLLLFGIVSIGAGILITLFASRKAPDGFEDQAGFHVGRDTETFVDDFRSNGWLGNERDNHRPTSSTPPAAS